MLSWFGAQHRGHYVAQRVRRLLRKNGLVTKPDFEYAYIDSNVNFELAPVQESSRPIGFPELTTPVVESVAPVEPAR
ncbi:MAG: hypothetical protein ACRD4L_06465 [Pyrinomonadaceae bacterium]